MNDMSQVIIPRSDQINADTLLAGPMTVTVKAVHISGGQEQPVSISLEETPLFFRPCKSMSRCLVTVWGPDANKYVGRRLTLYRDPTVKWGGLEVGGIRISHMSHLDNKMVMQLTATKGQRKPHTVMPLATNGDTATGLTLDQARADMTAAMDLDELKTVWTRKAMAPHREALGDLLASLKVSLSGTESQIEREGRADTDMGEAHNNDHPAASKAADIIAQAKGAQSKPDLIAAQAEWGKHRGAIEAHDERLAVDVNNAILAANDRLNKED